jgi:hypothetical protein
MKPWHPRRRGRGDELHKQALSDLRHRISSDIGCLIVLVEQGNINEIPAAQQRAKNDFLKHSTEMQKIAQKMGERFVRAVRNYLDSVDLIVHTNASWLDEAKIRHCFTMTQELEKELTVA